MSAIRESGHWPASNECLLRVNNGHQHAYGLMEH